MSAGSGRGRMQTQNILERRLVASVPRRGGEHTAVGVDTGTYILIGITVNFRCMFVLYFVFSFFIGVLVPARVQIFTIMIIFFFYYSLILCLTVASCIILNVMSLYFTQ